jgi:hypothetical protein
VHVFTLPMMEISVRASVLLTFLSWVVGNWDSLYMMVIRLKLLTVTQCCDEYKRRILLFCDIDV